MFMDSAGTSPSSSAPDTALIVIRHGETLWNREKRMQGTTDTPLSDIGQAQARALGFAHGDGVDAAVQVSLGINIPF